MKNRIVSHRWCAITLGTLLALSQFPLASLAQEIPSEQLVDALVNANSPPEMVQVGKFRKLALFPKEYDWKEQDRIEESIVALEKQLDASFDVVVEHLDDDRYCFTMYNDNSESASNRSVGDVCDQLLLEAVIEPYMQFEGDLGAYIKMRRPLGLSQRSKGLTEWFQTRTREGKRLVDLQIEACEWAEKAFENLEGISDEAKKTAIQKTKQQLVTLRKDRTPVAAYTITRSETYQIAGEYVANRMRKEIEARPKVKVKGEKGGR